MSEAHVISSLLSHCKTCESKCCKDSYIIHTKTEYTRIIDAGYTDHFKEIILPEGSFYVLYFMHKPCPYLGSDNTCSIEDVKSDTCRAYPAQAAFDMTGRFLQTRFDKTCPALQSLCDTFKIQASELMNKHAEDAPYALHRKILDKYMDSVRTEKPVQQPHHVITTLSKPNLSAPPLL